MFVDLDWPLNASSLLSASAELLVIACCRVFTAPLDLAIGEMCLSSKNCLVGQIHIRNVIKVATCSRWFLVLFYNSECLVLVSLLVQAAVLCSVFVTSHTLGSIYLLSWLISCFFQVSKYGCFITMSWLVLCIVIICLCNAIVVTLYISSISCIFHCNNKNLV